MSETTPPASGSRRAKYVLIGSLALNLLFIGAVVGMGFKHHHGPGSHRGPHFSLFGLTRVLPDDRRKEVVDILKAQHDEMRPMRGELQKARYAAAESLAAEPFDRAAVENAIAVVAEKERALRQATLDTFLSQAARLSADERRQLSERWRKRADWMARRDKKKAKDDK